MRLLKDLLYKCGAIELNGSTNLAIMSVTSDSRNVVKNGLFVAVKGTASDGHNYIGRAVDSGAIAIICEEMPLDTDEKVTYVKVRDSAFALGIIAANFFDNPSSRLKVTGVTGTNGKTTTATLLFRLFRSLGYNCGLISTVQNQINDEPVPSTHTTPDAVQLQQLFSRMEKAGCSHVFMEVSSHAVDQKRIAGTEFTLGVFTNISHDHLDYHKNFDNYLAAKQQFFSQLSSSAYALVNRDDPNGDLMVALCPAQIKTYGLSAGSDFRCKILEKQLGGMLLRINEHELWTPLIGTFNAYNLLAVFGSTQLLGVETVQALTAISSLSSVDGRFQYLISPNKVTAIVDYAHTPDALRNVLNTIRDIRTGNEQVITVVGCGGDRDAAKRPEMARIATEMSNRVIITSDNPRSEDPEEIIRQMKAGIEPQHYKKALSITDRREAIRTAFALASEGDIILIAGKGHEKYQEIKGVKYPFDDLQEVRETFKSVDN